ncbi:MAG: twin-arginine translocation signal domain-containing protein [Thaumarchaeota archaeon]|nr:twin-arginine translocation signal domain-containing protein [Nitrososphaerota archaeon]
MADEEEFVQDTRGTVTRRDFLKLLAAGGIALAFTPFVPWGKFMPDPTNTVANKVKITLPGGGIANIKTFPVDSSEVVTYPVTGDPVLDSEPFRKWQLVRLPASMGGTADDVSAFRCYSMVCLHLWCLWKYWPQPGRMRGECPCHGSMYRMQDGLAFAGPASLQAPPSNVLPILYLEADGNGDLWILPAIWNVNDNGIVGYGRFLQKS